MDHATLRQGVVRVVRWWFGLTYLLGGIGCLVAGPIMIASGNAGGIYMLGGGLILAVIGWFIHPWGLQKRSWRASDR